MSAEDERVIEVSNNQLALKIMGCVIFSAVGLFLVFSGEIIAAIIGIACILFFGVGGFFLAIKYLFDARVNLVFNSSGIMDNSNLGSVGMVPWSDVLGAETVQVAQDKFLVVKLKNPEAYLKSGDTKAQTARKGNYKMYGSPVILTSSNLKASFSTLEKTFFEYKDKYAEGNNEEETVVPDDS